jgi:thioredoxin-related protein
MANWNTGRRVIRSSMGIAAMLWLLAAPSFAAPAGIAWLSWPDGIAAARRQGRPALVYFHQPNCKFCNRMDAETFADARVQQAVTTCFVPARVESFNPTVFVGPGGEKLSGVLLRDRYRVTTYPTIIGLATGRPLEELMRVPGFFGPTDFLGTLAYVTEGWYRKMSFGEFLEQRLGGRLPAPPGGGTC